MKNEKNIIDSRRDDNILLFIYTGDERYEYAKKRTTKKIGSKEKI